MHTEMWALSHWVAVIIKWFKHLVRSGSNPPKQSGDEVRQSLLVNSTGMKDLQSRTSAERGLPRQAALL